MWKTALIVALALAPISFGQERDAYGRVVKPPDPEMMRQEVVNLEMETGRAMQLNNSTFFQRVYGDDYQGTSSRGQLMDKAAVVQSAQASSFKYDSLEVKDINIRFFGSTAVATARWIIHGKFLGRPINAEMRTMHIYINGRRGWQAVAGEETPVQ